MSNKSATIFEATCDHAEQVILPIDGQAMNPNPKLGEFA